MVTLVSPKCTGGVYRIRPFVGVEIVLVPCHFAQKSSRKLFMRALSVPGVGNHYFVLKTC